MSAAGLPVNLTLGPARRQAGPVLPAKRNVHCAVSISCLPYLIIDHDDSERAQQPPFVFVDTVHPALEDQEVLPTDAFDSMTPRSFLIAGPGGLGTFANAIFEPGTVSRVQIPPPRRLKRDMFLRAVLLAGMGVLPCAGQLNQAWVQKHDLPEARIFEIAASINGRILAVTSGEDGKPGTEVFEYRPSYDTWTRKSHANLVRHSFGAGVAGGKVFIWGGIAEGNPDTDTWTRKAGMPEPRMFAKGAEVGGMLYAVGGIQPPGRNQVPLLHQYDPKTDRWARKTDMPEKRDAYRVAAARGRVYVIGNLNGSTHVLEYDPASGRWATRSAMPTPRFDFGIHAAGGLIYTFGGMGKSTVEVYDPANDRWLTKRSMPRENWCQVLAEANGRIYIIGGGFPDPIGSLYEYNPVLDR